MLKLELISTSFNGTKTKHILQKITEDTGLITYFGRNRDYLLLKSSTCSCSCSPQMRCHLEQKYNALSRSRTKTPTNLPSTIDSHRRLILCFSCDIITLSNIFRGHSHRQKTVLNLLYSLHLHQYKKH